jgi:hypothetical protein
MLRKLLNRPAQRKGADDPAQPLLPTAEAIEVDGLAVRWIMTDGRKNIVCWARAAALEKLEANPDLEKASYLEAFHRHRPKFEAAAAAIHKRGLLDGNAIVVRKENV